MGNEAEKPPKRSRAGGPKVKTGCITCKIRRVKCDEGIPNCHRCTSTGRKCDGYQQRKETTQDASLNPLRQRNCSSLSSTGFFLGANETTNELRSLAYFRNHTAPLLSGYFDSKFWSELLLQICHSDSTIRQAIIAVSAVHEQYENRAGLRIGQKHSQPAEADHRFALCHYNAAISSLHDRLSAKNLPLEILLVTCVLFTCLEFLRGGKEAAVAHLHSGARIICFYHEGSISKSLDVSNTEFVETVFQPIFVRLNILSSIVNRPAIDIFAKLRNRLYSTSFSTPSSFSNLLEARDSLTNIAILVIDLDISCSEFPKDMQDEPALRKSKQEIEGRVRQWSRTFAEFMRSSLASMNSQEIRGATLLNIQHKGMALLLESTLNPEQFVSEGCNDDFESIVCLSEFLMQEQPNQKTIQHQKSRFSFEMGIIPQLFLTATRCSSAMLRQRAVTLLSTSSRREALWDSLQSAADAETIIAMHSQRVDG